MGWGNTATGHVCVPTSICRIAGREKGLVSHEVGAKIGQGVHEAGLPGWPTPLLGDWTREFGHPIQELRAGTIRSTTITNLGEPFVWTPR